MPILLNPDEYAPPPGQPPMVGVGGQAITDPLIATLVQRLAAAQPQQGQWVNQQAEQYAQQRLAQAAKAGLIHPGYQLAGGAAATWRNVSAQIAEQAAQHGYRDAGHWLDQGAPGRHLPPNAHQGRHAVIQHLARQHGSPGQWSLA